MGEKSSRPLEGERERPDRCGSPGNLPTFQGKDYELKPGAGVEPADRSRGQPTSTQPSTKTEMLFV